MPTRRCDAIWNARPITGARCSRSRSAAASAGAGRVTAFALAQASAADSTRIQLLADIREGLRANGREQLSSAEIIKTFDRTGGPPVARIRRARKPISPRRSPLARAAAHLARNDLAHRRQHAEGLPEKRLSRCVGAIFYPLYPHLRIPVLSRRPPGPSAARFGPF